MRAIKSPKKRKTAKGVLKQMRKYLVEQKRWTQGDWFTGPEDASWTEVDPALDDGGVCKMCLDGALQLCAANEDVYNDAVAAIKNVLPDDVQDVVAWNDVIANEIKDVDKMLSKAIKRA